jgi:hypothetical protein
MECYGLTGPYNVVVDMEPAGVGQVKINSLELGQYPWDGKYFHGVDIKLSALETNPYFEFDKWVLKHHQVMPNDSAVDVTLDLTTGDTILALFKPRVFEDSLVINEINYNSSEGFDPGDWVELYNPHPYDLDVSGWIFKDEDDQHAFELPAGTAMPAEGYLVLVADTAAFDSLFPDVDNYLGPLGFGFSGNGEVLRIFDADGVEVDTVHYDDVAPWPTEPDGNGPTLELINPAWDNALAESWAASALNGTPGKINGNYVGVPDIPAEAPIRCRVYPNPFGSMATLRIEGLTETRDMTLRIFNLFGQEVRQIGHISSPTVVITSEGLAQGLYIYELLDRNGKRLFTGKFIIR